MIMISNTVDSGMLIGDDLSRVAKLPKNGSAFHRHTTAGYHLDSITNGDHDGDSGRNLLPGLTPSVYSTKKSDDKIDNRDSSSISNSNRDIIVPCNKQSLKSPWYEIDEIIVNAPLNNTYYEQINPFAEKLTRVGLVDETDASSHGKSSFVHSSSISSSPSSPLYYDDNKVDKDYCNDSSRIPDFRSMILEEFDPLYNNNIEQPDEPTVKSTDNKKEGDSEGLTITMKYDMVIGDLKCLNWNETSNSYRHIDASGNYYSIDSEMDERLTKNKQNGYHIASVATTRSIDSIEWDNENRRQMDVTNDRKVKKSLSIVKRLIVRKPSTADDKEQGASPKLSRCYSVPDIDYKSLKKPVINTSLAVSLHNGLLLKLCLSSSGDKVKDVVQRWCQLGEGKLFYAPDKTAAVKGFVSLDSVLSVQNIPDGKVSYKGSDVYCFEIVVSNCSRPYIFGALSTTERRMWMQKLLENLTFVFPTRYTADYFRAGWCFINEGINGEWTWAWILLQKRTLVYSSVDDKRQVMEIDLRKVRLTGLYPVSSGSKWIIRLDTTVQSFYFVMEKYSVMAEWKRVIKAASVDNGVVLNDQQLTNDNVPVIVEKCINFVYTHGSMSEGIYRRSGANCNVSNLLSLFRQDAWSLQINRQDYTEYDISNVLKRFFRDLSEPLFDCELCLNLSIKTAGLSEEEKIAVYKDAIEKFSPIKHVTVRKLLGHLHFIAQLSDKNLMTVDNLVTVWGPTLTHSEETDKQTCWSKEQSSVMADLILLYPKLFVIDDDELERERQMKIVLEKYNDSKARAVVIVPSKPSGDLIVWIYIHSKNNGKYVSVTVNPNKDCMDVYSELSPKMGILPHLLYLYEYILDGALIRPMHHSEKPFDVVLRWSYWDEIDRKDNYLVVTTTSVIQEILPFAILPLSISEELKFADPKTKSFKNYLLEINQCNLTVYKDKKRLVKLYEWNIVDLIWYMGHETKRDPRARWSITFVPRINKIKRSKSSPYFGYTVAGNNKDDQLQWIAAFLMAEYADLAPSDSSFKKPP